jgi:Tfp pilus assembly protein PilV
MKHTLALVVIVIAVLAVQAFAQQSPARAAQQAGIAEAIELLAAATDRQAAAWEKLAERGWPTPQNYTLTGSIPRSLDVNLSTPGYLDLRFLESRRVDLSGSVSNR